MTMNQTQIESLLKRNDLAVERAIIALHDRKRGFKFSDVQKTVVGITDVQQGKYFSEWIKRGHKLSGVHLTRARKLALAYSAQLTAIAAGIDAPDFELQK